MLHQSTHDQVPLHELYQSPNHLPDDNDDDDSDDDDEFFFVVWLTDERRLDLFPAGTTVRDPHHRESPTRRQQGLKLRRT